MGWQKAMQPEKASAVAPSSECCVWHDPGNQTRYIRASANARRASLHARVGYTWPETGVERRQQRTARLEECDTRPVTGITAGMPPPSDSESRRGEKDDHAKHGNGTAPLRARRTTQKDCPAYGHDAADSNRLFPLGGHSRLAPRVD